MERTPKTPAAATPAVTVHQPFHIGAAQLFAVQPGIALDDAFATLSLLLGTTRDALTDLAVLMEPGGDRPIEQVGAGLAWAHVYLLDVACALQSSIQAGLKRAQAQRGDSTEGV